MLPALLPGLIPTGGVGITPPTPPTPATPPVIALARPGQIALSVPHLTIPFTIEATGSAAVLMQDTVPEIVQSVAALVGTRPGTRLMAPKYGITDPTFTGIDQMALHLAVITWEPRATVSVNVTPANEEYVTVQVGQVTP